MQRVEKTDSKHLTSGLHADGQAIVFKHHCIKINIKLKEMYNVVLHKK